MRERGELFMTKKIYPNMCELVIGKGPKSPRSGTSMTLAFYFNLPPVTVVPVITMTLALI